MMVLFRMLSVGEIMVFAACGDVCVCVCLVCAKVCLVKLKLKRPDDDDDGELV